jgi:hypothetical protein
LVLKAIKAYRVHKVKSAQSDPPVFKEIRVCRVFRVSKEKLV